MKTTLPPPICSDPSIPDRTFAFWMHKDGKIEKVLLYGFSVLEAFQSKYTMEDWPDVEDWDYLPDVAAPAKAILAPVNAAPARVQGSTSFNATAVEEEETFEIVA